MAPVRRYLRITKYSVLECRIYLENPALADTWLLRKGDPALPRIFQAIRPQVLPKLREENERTKTKSKGKGKQAIKDVVAQGLEDSFCILLRSMLMILSDDFEVVIFLKDQPSRHTLLTKQKDFTEKPKIKSNSGKLTGWLSGGTTDAPIDLDAQPGPILIGDDDNEDVDLSAIPQAPQKMNDQSGMDIDDAVTLPSDDEDDDAGLFVAEDGSEDENGRDDKKKLAMKTRYDGFSIYGKMLCLIVKRRGASTALKTSPGSGQATMENWVSTQVAQELGIDEED